jgi:hypothetical protein
MLRNYTFLSILILSSVCFAQDDTESSSPISQGRYIVDGNFSANFLNEEVNNAGFSSDQDSFNSELAGGFQYFVIDRLAVGINLGVLYERFDEEETDFFTGAVIENEFRSSAILIGPSVRYFITDNLFASASLGFTFGRTETSFGEGNSNGLFYDAGLGYAFFLNDYISVEPTVSYFRNRTEPEDSNLEFISSGVRIGAGFTIYL